MSQQIQSPITQQPTKQAAPDLITAAQQAAAKVQSKPMFRKVRLKFKSCCGCGCNTVTIEREVPYDSPLRGGEYADKLNQTDKVVS